MNLALRLWILMTVSFGFAQICSAATISFTWRDVTNPLLTGDWQNSPISSVDAISPDGKKIVYSVTKGLDKNIYRTFITSVDDQSNTRLLLEWTSDLSSGLGTLDGAQFSPDSRFLVICGEWPATSPIRYVVDTQDPESKLQKLGDDAIACPARQLYEGVGSVFQRDLQGFTSDSNYLVYQSGYSDANVTAFRSIRLANVNHSPVTVVNNIHDTTGKGDFASSNDRLWYAEVHNDRDLLLTNVSGTVRKIGFESLKRVQFTQDSRYLVAEGVRMVEDSRFEGLFSVDLSKSGEPTLIGTQALMLTNWAPGAMDSVFLTTAQRLLTVQLSTNEIKTIRRFASTTDEAKSFAEGLWTLQVSPDQSYGLMGGENGLVRIGQDGTLVIIPEFKYLRRFGPQGAFAVVGVGNDWGLLDRDGKVLISGGSSHFIGTSDPGNLVFWRPRPELPVVKVDSLEGLPAADTSEFEAKRLYPLPNSGDVVRIIERKPEGHPYTRRPTKQVLQIGKRD